jgi:hypothetical protein
MRPTAHFRFEGRWRGVFDPMFIGKQTPARRSYDVLQQLWVPIGVSDNVLNTVSDLNNIPHAEWRDVPRILTEDK